MLAATAYSVLTHMFRSQSLFSHATLGFAAFTGQYHLVFRNPVKHEGINLSKVAAYGVTGSQTSPEHVPRYA